MLSRRLMNFTYHGIFFTCQSSPPLYQDLAVIATDTSQLPFAQLKTLFSSRTPAGELWYRLITRYAALPLTRKEDRLIAAAGIAKEYRRILVAQKKADLRYVAGLWMWDIHQGLLWHRIGSLVQHERLPREPSWSWTSAIATVDWPKLKRTSRWIAPRKECSITPCQDIASEEQLSSQQLRLAIREFEFLSTKIFFKEAPSFRAVWSVSKPGIIAGFGSFEGESIQARLGSSAGIYLCVCPACTDTLCRRPLQYALGWISPIIPVYDVLYLDPVANGENEYYRLGAGCLFEPGLLREFSPLLTTDISLI
ncbi:hypothetical protein F4782DRAFT_239848 [Xylaria castorea]|nr:hypothetical protein F4782DRAFT_239848 [Xylaria castorea]